MILNFTLIVGGPKPLIKYSHFNDFTNHNKYKKCSQGETVQSSMWSGSDAVSNNDFIVLYYLQYCLTCINDQPLHDGTQNLAYADDQCVTVQYLSFTEVEHAIEKALDELTIYYVSNSLRANPDKTQVTAFHLKNREEKMTLEVKWNKTDLKNTSHLKYLGVTLDRTLSYKQHIHNTKMKVATQNNLLKKLSNSKWCCNASTIRTTALVLSYSSAEYACQVWPRSPHASKLDLELIDACRSITGCLRPTNVEELYLISGTT